MKNLLKIIVTVLVVNTLNVHVSKPMEKKNITAHSTSWFGSVTQFTERLLQSFGSLLSGKTEEKKSLKQLLAETSDALVQNRTEQANINIFIACKKTEINKKKAKIGELLTQKNKQKTKQTTKRSNQKIQCLKNSITPIQKNIESHTKTLNNLKQVEKTLETKIKLLNQDIQTQLNNTIQKINPSFDNNYSKEAEAELEQMEEEINPEKTQSDEEIEKHEKELK